MTATLTRSDERAPDRPRPRPQPRPTAPVRPQESAENKADRSIAYVPALDGLRAFAVVGAMLFHAGVLTGGFLGVDLFFVLSGFLISSILLGQAMRAGTFGIGSFWVRRVRRLAPALLAVLAVVTVWTYTAASPSMAQTTAKQTGWSLAYANNWFAIFGHLGYWDAKATDTPLNHLWSLSIEEQFYLVWPVVLLAVVRLTRRPRVVVAVAAAAVVASGLWQWWLVDRHGTQRAYLDTGARAESLFLGCLLAAILVARRKTRHGGGPSRASWLPSAVVVGCAGWLGTSWALADLNSAVLYHGWLVSCGVAAAALIGVVATHPDAWYGRFLGAPVLVWIGKRSYSLYLWHWPLWAMITPTVISGTATQLWLVRIAVTVVVSALSYRLLETPIRRSSLKRGLVLVVALPAAAMAAIVVALPPTLPAELGTAPVTLAGNGGTGSLTVLLAGDSWARNMGYGLASADTAHRNTYINLGASGCGIAPGQTGDCEQGEARWAQAVTADHPDVALLLTGTVDQENGALIGGQRVYPCNARFDSAYATALDRTIAALHGPANIPVYVVTVRDNIDGKVDESNCMNQLLTAAAARDNSSVLDLHAQLCPAGQCMSQLDGQPVYDDTMHLGPAGQKWIGRWILGTLQHQVVGHLASHAPTVGPCTPRKGARAKALTIRSYTSPSSKLYPDSAQHKLTDHQLGQPIVFDHAWVGWQTKTGDVKLTLAYTQDVCTVDSTWLQELDAAIYPPSGIDVYVSQRPGLLGRQLGTALAPQLSSDTQSVVESVTAARPLRGRYITIRVNALTGWSFVDEVSAHGVPAKTPRASTPSARRGGGPAAHKAHRPAAKNRTTR